MRLASMPVNAAAVQQPEAGEQESESKHLTQAAIGQVRRADEWPSRAPADQSCEHDS